MTDPSATRSRLPIVAVRLLLWLAIVVALLVVLSVWARDPGIAGYARARVPELVAGTAPNPFARRALVPWLARALAGSLDDAGRARVTSLLAGRSSIAELGWEREALAEYAAVLLVAGVALLCFAVSLGWLFTGLYRAPPPVAELVVLAGLLGVPALFRHHNYLHDPAVLCLWTLALALLARGRHAAYLVVFVVACLNKETTLLLALVFWLHEAARARLARGRIVSLTAVLCLVWLVVTGGLVLLYRGNGGRALELHWLDYNLRDLPAWSLESAVAILLLGLLAARDWRAKPLLLRTAAWAALPLAGLWLAFGVLDEPRVFLELYPVGLLLVLDGGLRWAGVPIATREAER